MGRGIGVRWAILASAVAAAFAPSWARLGADLVAGDRLLYLTLLPVWLVVAVAGVQARHQRELPIHDREADAIIGTSVCAVALAMQYLLAPRLLSTYRLAHIDLLACWVFLLGAAILLFGTRPALRFRWCWVLLAFAGWPLVYRLVVTAAGGGLTVIAIVNVVIAAAVGALALGSSRRTLLLVGGGVAAGTAAGVILHHAGGATEQLVPCALTTVLLAGVWLARVLHGGRLRPARRSVNGLSWRCAAVVAASALGLVVLGPELPASARIPQVGADAAINADSLVPSGWRLLGSTDFGWTPRYYGANSTLRRNLIVQQHGSIQFDKDAAPRRVVIDTLTVGSAAPLDVYGVAASYPINGQRQRAPQAVDLGHGVQGQLYDTVDTAVELTYTVLSFTWRVSWQSGSALQRVTVLSVDDHRPSATFPVPSPSLGSEVRAALARIVRGDASTQDTNAAPKDHQLLIDVGQGIVESAAHPRLADGR